MKNNKVYFAIKYLNYQNWQLPLAIYQGLGLNLSIDGNYYLGR